MLKKTITYEDYNGVERKEDFYFNLTKAEIMEMEMSEAGGMSEMIKKIVDAKKYLLSSRSSRISSSRHTARSPQTVNALLNLQKSLKHLLRQRLTLSSSWSLRLMQTKQLNL